MSDSESTISAVFVPVAEIPGTSSMTYHETLVYTTPGGSYYISAGPTVSNSSLGLDFVQKGENIVLAAASVGTNNSSIWGTLKVEGSGSFVPNDTSSAGGVDVVPELDPGTGIRNANVGTVYASQVLVTAPDLSAQWGTIVSTYNNIAALNLTYSPLTQNSNSVANTAFKRKRDGFIFFFGLLLRNKSVPFLSGVLFFEKFN